MCAIHVNARHPCQCMPSRQSSSRALASHPGVFPRSLMDVTALRDLCRAFDWRVQPFMPLTLNPCNPPGHVWCTALWQSCHRGLHPDPTSSSNSYCSQNHLCPSQWGRQYLFALLGFLQFCEEQSTPDLAVSASCLHGKFWQVRKNPSCVQLVPPFLTGALRSFYLFLHVTPRVAYPSTHLNTVLNPVCSLKSRSVQFCR